MKFFYINNSQCTGCDRCIAVCPTGAIYLSDEKRHINYNKCTSCGSCMKVCNDDAIWLESVSQMVMRMEKADIYEGRIRRLEMELSLLRERLDNAEYSIKQIVTGLPVAALIADSNACVVTANEAMIRLAGIDALALADMPGDLAGESVTNLLPAEIAHLLVSSGEQIQQVGLLKGVTVSITVVPLVADSVMCVIRNLQDRNVAAEEVLSLLRDTIERKMEMVRQIGTLLGDEASAGIGSINAAVRIIQQSDSQNKTTGDGDGK